MEEWLKSTIGIKKKTATESILRDKIKKFLRKQKEEVYD